MSSGLAHATDNKVCKRIRIFAMNRAHAACHTDSCQTHVAYIPHVEPREAKDLDGKED